MGKTLQLPLNAADAGAVHPIKWAVHRARYMTLESIAPLGDDPTVMLPAMAARHTRPDQPEPTWPSRQ